MSGLPLIEAPTADLSDEQRNLACRDMLDPYLTALASAVIDTGWHPAEVAAAMLGHAVDAIRAGAGVEEAMASIQGVVKFLEREKTAPAGRQ